jgi:hypothetical protein
LGELDDLLTQFQLHDTHVGVEHARQRVVFGADYAKIRDFLELQHVDEEARLAIHVRNREANRFDALDAS